MIIILCITILAALFAGSTMPPACLGGVTAQMDMARHMYENTPAMINKSFGCAEFIESADMILLTKYRTHMNPSSLTKDKCWW